MYAKFCVCSFNSHFYSYKNSHLASIWRVIIGLVLFKISVLKSEVCEAIVSDLFDETYGSVKLMVLS